MTCIRRPWLAQAALLATCVGTSAVWAQSTEFADDFSTNTIRYTTEYRVSGANGATASNVEGGVELSVRSENDEYVEARVSVIEQVQSLGITGRFDTTATSLNEGGDALLSIGGTLFNDSNNGVIDSDSHFGDIYLGLNSGVFPDGSTNLFVCMGREGENGFEDYGIFEDGNACQDYSAIAPAAGDELDIAFSITGPSEITIRSGVQSDVITLPGTVHAPNRPYNYIQLGTSGNSGTSTFLLESVSTDDVVDDFSVTPPVLDRYNIFADAGDNALSWQDERVRVAYSTTSDDYSGVDIRFNSITSYLEATLEFSADSDIASVGSSVEADIRSEVANDTQDGGFDGRVGDIRADISLVNRYNGLRRAEYCLYRYVDAAGDEREGLLNGGANRCVEFPVRVEFDTPYRVAIAVDEVSGTVTFRLNGFSHVEALSGPLYEAAEPRMRVSMGAFGGGELLGYIDDVRNSPSALTASEVASGSGTPTAFPAEPSAESLMVDSTLDAPFDLAEPVGFVDDFSSDTSLLTIEVGSEAGSSSFTYTDGAVELQAHSTRDPDEGGGSTAFDIIRPTDSIRVRAAVTSDSRIPAGGDAEASFDLEAVFLNDTADGGYQGRAGDIQTKIRIRFEGSGRARVEAEMARRDESGSNQRLNVFPDGEDRYYFNDFLPVLDQAYDISIRLDRELGAMVYAIDEEEIRIPLTSDIFVPAQRRIQVRAYHRGTSGRAVVRLFSVETDTELLNFAEAPPVIAPYRTPFDATGPGSEVSAEAGRLKLITDGRISGDTTNTNFRLRGNSTHVGAEIELSGDSVIGAAGFAMVGLGGSLYTDLDNGPDNSEGTVFSTVRLHSNSEQGRYVEYCAYRSNDESFSDAVELLGGDPDNCPRFTTVPELDTSYPASVSLDPVAMTLTLRFADEMHVHNIGTDIFIDADQFNGVRVRASGNSMAVGYVDNLAFAEDAVPLAQSDDNLGSIGSDTPVSGVDSGDTGSDTGGDTEASGGSSGGSGGGCSVTGKSGTALWLMAGVALLGLRRRARASQLRVG